LAVGAGRRGTRVPAAALLAVASVPPSVSSSGAIDLSSGDPDPALLPALEPALASLRFPSTVRYGDAPVDRALRLFAAGEFEADGIPSGAMTVVSGALDAIDRILREHLRVGDRVAIEDPSLPAIVDLLSASGLVPVPFALDGQGPLPGGVEQALRGGCRAIVMTSRGQNPTGAAVDADRAGALRRVLRRFPDTVLIENDPVAPIAGVPISPLRTGPAERWAVVRSTSKFLGPDIRVALVAGDELTVARVHGRQALGARWVSRILQQLVLALWSDPSSARRLARAAEIYAQRRQALCAALSRYNIDVIARSGFNVWIPVRNETEVVHDLAIRGWAVAAGERFRIQAGPAIRVNVSTLEGPEAGRFAADLSQALRPSRSTPV
jgi:DNA-binding transcriptional MocR family regulator